MKLRHPPLRLLLPVVVLAALTAACAADPTPAPPGAAAAPSPAGPAPAGSAGPTASSPASPAASTAPAAAATITIKDFKYDVPAKVPAGAEIMVVNKDGEAHTVTLGGTDVNVVVQGKETVKLTTPAKAGKYKIGCDFHGSMTAELVVT